LIQSHPAPLVTKRHDLQKGDNAISGNMVDCDPVGLRGIPGLVGFQRIADLWWIRGHGDRRGIPIIGSQPAGGRFRLFQ